MRVEVIRTGQGLTRYVLTDDNGAIIEPVVKFIRYKDMSGKARNTLKAYCYHLKAYYEFLDQKQKTAFEVTIDDIAGFVNWLRSPIQSVNVMYISGTVSPKRKARTVNMHVSTVMGFHCMNPMCFDFIVNLISRYNYIYPYPVFIEIVAHAGRTKKSASIY